MGSHGERLKDECDKIERLQHRRNEEIKHDEH